MNLWFIGYLVAISVVTFLLVLFPARWIGKWLSGNNMPMLLGIIACIKITIAFIAFVSFFLIMMRFDFLPHVNTGKQVSSTSLRQFFSAFPRSRRWFMDLFEHAGAMRALAIFQSVASIFKGRSVS